MRASEGERLVGLPVEGRSACHDRECGCGGRVSSKVRVWEVWVTVALWKACEVVRLFGIVRELALQRKVWCLLTGGWVMEEYICSSRLIVP